MVKLKVLDAVRLKSPESDCAYVPSQQSAFDYRVVPDLSSGQYEALLSRGWRKQGYSIFRPVCRQCRRCVSLRVDVGRFRPTKSQRRNLRKNEGVQLIVQPPTISEEHLKLFDRYHADMTERRGWRENSTSVPEYYESFLAGEWDFAREYLYFYEDRLIAVGIVDETANSQTSVYFYHDPDWRTAGLGTYSILKEIEQAQLHGRSWVYLGYWISECQSMEYKANFGPHEVLLDYCNDDEEPEWIVIEGR